jgi:hypothetical protein
MKKIFPAVIAARIPRVLPKSSKGTWQISTGFTIKEK